jgi:hypothetical protein
MHVFPFDIFILAEQEIPCLSFTLQKTPGTLHRCKVPDRKRPARPENCLAVFHGFREFSSIQFAADLLTDAYPFWFIRVFVLFSKRSNFYSADVTR